LQDLRTNAFGFHFAWQPARAPLNLRSEYARSVAGSGYWIEGAYRLSQARFWQKAMRRTEIALRGQQFFHGASADEAAALGLPGANTRQAEFGVNYFLRDGLKAAASYGRQFSSAGNLNIWTVGLAYRFLLPLGRVGQPSMSPQALGAPALDGALGAAQDAALDAGPDKKRPAAQGGASQ
jgi:hypothetical protein